MLCGLSELRRKAKRFAVLINLDNAVTAEATTKALKEAAPDLGLELLFFKASTPAEIDAAFSAIADGRRNLRGHGLDGGEDLGPRNFVGLPILLSN
jgi:hypothetical protein